MIALPGEFTRRSFYARIVRDVDLEESRFPAFFGQILRCGSSCPGIARSDENVKPTLCELARDFSPNAFVCSRNQDCFHFLLGKEGE